MNAVLAGEQVSRFSSYLCVRQDHGSQGDEVLYGDTDRQVIRGNCDCDTDRQVIRGNCDCHEFHRSTTPFEEKYSLLSFHLDEVVWLRLPGLPCLA